VTPVFTSVLDCLVDSIPFKNLSDKLPREQAWLFGQAAMMALPNITDEKDAIYAYVSEALHFRRGTRTYQSLHFYSKLKLTLENFRCLDTEWEIPIPAAADGDRDYEMIQRAWCAFLLFFYSAES
jgi:hypothetical protein